MNICVYFVSVKGDHLHMTQTAQAALIQNFNIIVSHCLRKQRSGLTRFQVEG